MTTSAKTLGVVDIPIADPAADALGLGRYAQALANFILACDTPMTIGIQGDWGAGKTSLMNLIDRELLSQQSRPVPTTFTLNTWQYAQVAEGDLLSMVLLRALHERVAGRDKGIAQAWGALARTFGRLKSFQLGGVGVEVGEDEVATLPDLANLKKVFRDAVAARLALAGNGSDRIVVFIDDLDRILPERAVEILEALKNFVDVPGCVFVLACDYAVVTKGLTKKFHVGEAELGRSFFDKIIQVPFRMPVYRYDVDRYLRGMLDHIRWRVGGEKEAIDVYRKLIESSVGFNPRGLKRLCNTLLLLRMVAEGWKETAPLVQSEHNLLLLFGLVCMETAHERLYGMFATSTEHEVMALLDGASSPDDAPATEFSVSEREFLVVLGSAVDQDRNNRISSDEVTKLLAMMRLSAVTSLSDDAARREDRFPSVDELISRGVDARQQDKFSPLLALIRPLEGSVLRVRTTKGSITWDIQKRDGKWASAFGLTPYARTTGGPVFFVYLKLMEEVHPDPRAWAAVLDALERRPGASRSDGGGMMRTTLDSAAETDAVIEILRRAWPFARAE